MVTTALFLYMALATNPPDNLAWWLTENLEPNSSEILGVPVSRLDASFISVRIPRIEDIPSDGRYEAELIRRGEYSFQVVADLNGDRRPERVIVGTYASRDNTKGRFLAILSEERTRRVLFVDKWPGKPGFAFLERSRDHLYLSFCLECDGLSEVRWRGRRFIVVGVGSDGG